MILYMINKLKTVAFTTALVMLFSSCEVMVDALLEYDWDDDHHHHHHHHRKPESKPLHPHHHHAKPAPHHESKPAPRPLRHHASGPKPRPPKRMNDKKPNPYTKHYH